MRNRFSEKFKQNMVQKLLMPNAPAATQIAKKHGFHYTNLLRWKREYANHSKMNNSKNKSTKKTYSPQEKLKAVNDTANLNENELGIYLRKNGFYSHQIDEWNNEIIIALKAKYHPQKKDPHTISIEKENKELRKELNRKEKALAETAALLVLKKKVSLLFSEEE